MRIEPWQPVTGPGMAAVYRAEHARFMAKLGWDTSATWTALEQARVAGRVPGLVAHDAGGLCGWTFYVEQGAELQIGAFTAVGAALDPLLDAVLESPEAGRCRQVRLFGHTDAPGLADALVGRGFRVGTYDYLTAALAAPAAVGGAVRAWRHADLAAAVDLLARAYAAPDALRPFGGTGRPADWIEYVAGLTTTPGCGDFAPDLSGVVPGADGALDAIVLVTRLGPSMAHLAQMAVAPTARRRGLGTRILAYAMRQAADHRLTHMSLLVADDNTAARRLYAARGFRPAAAFLSAIGAAAAQPRRSTSAACVSGGVSTRR